MMNKLKTDITKTLLQPKHRVEDAPVVNPPAGLTNPLNPIIEPEPQSQKIWFQLGPKPFKWQSAVPIPPTAPVYTPAPFNFNLANTVMWITSIKMMAIEEIVAPMVDHTWDAFGIQLRLNEVVMIPANSPLKGLPDTTFGPHDNFVGPSDKWEEMLPSPIPVGTGTKFSIGGYTLTTNRYWIWIAMAGYLEKQKW